VDVFANYVRRARVIDGTSYFVLPATFCNSSSDTMVGWVSGTGGGGGGGLGGVAQIENGQGYGGESYADAARTRIDMLVPDGVTTVMLEYPAGPVGGFNRNPAPAFTTTARVIGNLMVVTIPRAGDRLNAPMTMTWRAANGHVVKTFNSL
jgi:hypothetical protein